MSESPDPRPDQEGFGEAELDEAQSDNPPADPEMVEDGGDGQSGVERTGGDQDSGPSGTDEQVDVDEQRDQAEG